MMYIHKKRLRLVTERKRKQANRGKFWVKVSVGLVDEVWNGVILLIWVTWLMRSRDSIEEENNYAIVEKTVQNFNLLLI